MSLKVSSLKLEDALSTLPVRSVYVNYVKNDIEDEYHSLLKCAIYAYEFNTYHKNMLLIRMYINLYCFCLRIIRKLYICNTATFIYSASAKLASTCMLSIL